MIHTVTIHTPPPVVTTTCSLYYALFFACLQYCSTGIYEPLEYRFLSHWYHSTQKNLGASGNRTPGLPFSRRTPGPQRNEAVKHSSESVGLRSQETHTAHCRTPSTPASPGQARSQLKSIPGKAVVRVPVEYYFPFSFLGTIDSLSSMQGNLKVFSRKC